MTPSTFIRALTLGVCLGLLSTLGCSAPSECNSTNCGGCCDEAGECRGGNTAAACGLGGSACISCGESVCSPDGTCFLSADGSVPGPVDVVEFPYAEDGGPGAEQDGGAGTDGGNDDGGAPDAGAPDAGTHDAGVDAGTFLPRDQCETPIVVGAPDAGNWTDRPVLDFAGGRVLLAYHEYIGGGGGRALFQTRLGEDGGFGPVVSHMDSLYARPSLSYLAVSSAGNVALVGQPDYSSWTRRVYSRPLDSWATLPWSSAPTSSERTLVVATGPESFFHTWYQLGPPVFASVSPQGVSAETPASSTSSITAYLHAAATPDGDVALAWVDTNRVLRGRFIAQTGLKSGGEAEHPEPSTVGQLPIPVVAPASGGDAYVFWERRNNDLSVQLMMTTMHDLPTGPTFDAPSVLVQTTTATHFGNLQALVDGSGEVTLTWIDLDRSTWALRRLSGTWGAPAAVSPATDSGIATNRRATIDRDGHVTVVYRSNTFPTRLELRRIARGSSTWQTPVQVTPAGAAVSPAEAALALDASDAPVVAWREDSATSPILLTTCR